MVCTTVWIHPLPPNRTFKNSWNAHFYIIYLLPQKVMLTSLEHFSPALLWPERFLCLGMSLLLEIPVLCHRVSQAHLFFSTLLKGCLLSKPFLMPRGNLFWTWTWVTLCHAPALIRLTPLISPDHILEGGAKSVTVSNLKCPAKDPAGRRFWMSHKAGDTGAVVNSSSCPFPLC